MGIPQKREFITQQWKLAHSPRTRLVKGVKILRGFRPPLRPSSTEGWCRFINGLRPGDCFIVEASYCLEIKWILQGLKVGYWTHKQGDLYQYTITCNPFALAGTDLQALARLVEQSIYKARYIRRVKRILEREMLEPKQRMLVRLLIEHPEVHNAEDADLAIVDKANEVAKYLLGENATWKDLKGKKIVDQHGHRKRKPKPLETKE